jgi:hypothetical protein
VKHVCNTTPCSQGAWQCNATNKSHTRCFCMLLGSKAWVGPQCG